MPLTSLAMRDAFGRHLVHLGQTHPELVVLDADVSSSTKTGLFAEAFPDRFFNVGVAEANMVDLAVGLATCGLRPVVSSFALFLAGKAAEQIRNCVAYNNLPVILAGGYAGLSDSYDGASHQSIADIAFMRALPNMTILSPGDAHEVGAALEEALRLAGPVYLRLGRNPTPLLFADSPPLQAGRNRLLRTGRHLTMLATGVPVHLALEAADKLAQSGIEAEVLAVSTLKPLDESSLLASVRKTGRVLTIEEHSVIGGLGGAVAERLAQTCPTPQGFIGIPDCFTESGDYDALLRKYGISVESIMARARELVQAGAAPLVLGAAAGSIPTPRSSPTGGGAGSDRSADPIRLSLAIAGKDALPSAFVVYRGFEDSIRKAAALGYDGVELALKRPEEVDRGQLRTWLGETGLEVSAISTGQVFAGLHLMGTDPDPQKRAELRSVLRGLIDLAAEFGQQVNLGRVRGTLNPWPRQESRGRFIDLARDLCQYAAPKGVTLLLEPVNRYEIDFINSVAEGVDLLREIDQPNLRLMPDVFHMNIEDPSIGPVLEQARPFLGYVHFADSNRLAPGQGHLDFDAILLHLRRSGYRGWVGIEILPKPDPDTAARQAIDFLRPRLRQP